MLKNYFKISIRNLLKQKLFSFINILSLTIGLACSLLLYLYVQDELSFDKFNSNKDSIYRVVQNTQLPDGSLEWQGIFHAIGLGPQMVEENPEVETSVRFYKPWGESKYYIKQNDRSFYDEILYADFDVFNVFDFPIVSGTVDNQNINSVVLSQSAANKYFGDENPVNKVLSFRIDGQFIDFTVAAVCEDIPSNSSIQFDVLLPFNYIASTEFKDFVDDWRFGAIITYVKLKDGTDPNRLKSSLEKLMITRYPNYQQIAEERGYKSVTDYRYFVLEPLLNVHFNTDVFEGLVLSSDPKYSYILLGLVIGILGIACFNFMNLSLSRSAHRVKEVGLRKTIGAIRSQLIIQFLGESVLLSFSALLFSLLVADLLLPIFNEFTNKQLEMSSLFSIGSFSTLIAISLFIGIVAGFYPAFVISKFNIKETLAGAKHHGAGVFTKILLVIQFSISAMLVVGMLVMNQQTNFLKNKDLGFDPGKVLVLRNSSVGESSIFTHFKNALPGFSGISSVTSASQNFANPSGLGGRGFEYKGERKRVGMIKVSENYMKTLGIHLVEGRTFNPSENAVIVNEACKKDFRLETNGQFSELTRSPETDPTVVGVMGDFNYSSLKSEIYPMLIQMTQDQNLSIIYVKLSGGNTDDAINFIKKEWTAVAPDLPFEYSFLNDTMRQQYAAEERWGNIIGYSMGITILLSCLGLFGVVALGLDSKKKEISIRKVFGARVANILWLITHSYLKLILLAFIIAVPVSYKFIQDWLSNFAYHIEITPKIYITAAAMIVGIAVLTISFKTIKTAISNPVKFLRNE
ncbi:MAG TPA: ABC transporter permease [Fulvivirga sp.]|nr:ABC transporter permease [Fulvivirga sp.]